ncbi:hypothetical protein J6590_098532 [Homalodisca vitripennis]|nr:hypothetical protein J6590_098532 [Homalodisca vitripennis]
MLGVRKKCRKVSFPEAHDHNQIVFIGLALLLQDGGDLVRRGCSGNLINIIFNHGPKNSNNADPVEKENHLIRNFEPSTHLFEKDSQTYLCLYKFRAIMVTSYIKGFTHTVPAPILPFVLEPSIKDFKLRWWRSFLEPTFKGRNCYPERIITSWICHEVSVSSGRSSTVLPDAALPMALCSGYSGYRKITELSNPEGFCAYKQPAFPAVGGGSEVNSKTLISKLSVTEGFVALTSSGKIRHPLLFYVLLLVLSPNVILSGHFEVLSVWYIDIF